MYQPVEIVNIGLMKIGSSRVNRLDPPSTPLERQAATGYVHWKRTELAKRRWVFATEDDVVLTKVEELTDVEKRYKYLLPTNCLRPLRDTTTEWKQRGRHVYSAYSSLRVSMVTDRDESEFDPLFIEVLAARCAKELAEPVTASNSKKDYAAAAYDEAVTVAGRNNAYVIGPERVAHDDSDFPFLMGRHYDGYYA